MVTLAAQALNVRIGSRPILADIDFALPGGGLIGIVGPNGAGKSTLLRALLGLVPAAGGVVRLGGKPVATMRRAAIAQAIAYLPQGQTVHWPLAVERLVALGRLPYLAPFSQLSATDRAAIDQAMAQCDIAPLRGRIVTELSGGERARVLLARALAMAAPILLVDEPLTSLDPAHQLDLMALLSAQAARGVTVVCVLHDLGIAARFCDRLLLLDKGRLVADGTADGVLSPARLAGIYGIAAWRGAAGTIPLLVPLARSD